MSHAINVSAQIALAVAATVSSGVAAAAQTEQAAAASTAADENSGSRDFAGDIIVTAQKRSEPLQQTPLSIVALTSHAMDKRNFFDINDLQRAVPNLTISPYSSRPNSSRIFIRGIGNNDDQITSDPSVAVYYDGVYVARSTGLGAEVADIERIEVLRGPQGSLYGRNATGGAINYISKPPVLGDFSAKQTLMFGNYDQFRARTTLNIPVGSTLAVSLGYLHAQKDGYVRNLGTGVSRWGDQRRDAYRAAVLWKPSDAFDLRYIYDRSDFNDTPVFSQQVPLYPAKGVRPTAGPASEQNLPRGDAAIQGHTLIASWTINDALTLKSISAYRDLRNYSRQSNLVDLGGGASVRVLADYWIKQEQFTQELQAVGQLFDDQLEYVLGVYYFEEKANTFDIVKITGTPDTDRTVHIKNTAQALFGQATYRPHAIDGLYVTGGIRWSRDKRLAILTRNSYPVGLPPIAQPVGNGNRTFSNVSPTAIIGYTPDRTLNLYAKFSKGYKTGGYNVRASTIAAFNAGYGEETVDAYEIGAKTSWLDGRLQVNVAAFNALYKDIQTSVPASPTNPTITDIFNAGRARIKGVEIDLTMRPTSSMTFQVNYGHLDAKYTRVLDAFGNDVTNNYVFINNPRHSLTVSADVVLARTSLGELSAFVDYHMESRKNAQINNLQYIIADYGVLNGRIALSDISFGSFGNWELAAFGKNLTDEKYYTTTFPNFRSFANFGDPRTYGLELTAKF